MPAFDFPEIQTIFDGSSENPISPLYHHSIRNILRRILPGDVDPASFDELLPIVKWQEWGEDSLNVSIFLLCPQRQNVGKFFYEMISRWLVPGRRLPIPFFFSTDFKLQGGEGETYNISEIVLKLSSVSDLERVRRSLPVLETEILLGTLSVYHASRILEIKGLFADEKTALVQEKIAMLVQRRPVDFDYDIFSQMQHFLVMCREEFKAMRESTQMSRIIYIFYLFRKALRRQVELQPHKRHLSLKLKKTRVHVPFGIKKVLGVFIGLNFLKENEIFEERHILKAFQNYIPQARAVDDSFFVNASNEDDIQTLYLEIEKEDGTEFTAAEIHKLRKHLKEDLKGHVEHLLKPIFMPRNEEEVMRNIVTLSQQLRYIRDIPQVIISFDEQTDAALSFTIIALRVLHEESRPVQTLFEEASSQLEYVPDRIKQVGMIRNKYPKEATVFRLRLPNAKFLREDHSVDLYKARQEVVGELQRAIGEIRDFNGGMISKQIEVFVALKNLLGEIGQKNAFLLENFFHSIFPVELRSVMDPQLLKTLFLLFLELQEQNLPNKKLTRQEDSHLFVMMGVQEIALKQKICDAVDHLHLATSELLWVHLQLFETMYLGYLYVSEDAEGQERFQQALDFSAVTA